jgi:hypothetical protein
MDQRKSAEESVQNRTDQNLKSAASGANGTAASTEFDADDGSRKLSYKFQRLRERLRAAIASGELTGKLPGERQLAKRFHVNAKTLSKALTDLAAEGLLDRSIGRGTFVRGAAPSAPLHSERWLIICDPDRAESSCIDHIKRVNGNVHVVTDTASLRPSFLSSIRAVIDLSTRTPDSFIRDLVVRNIAVVLVGREPTTYSVNAVLLDRQLGVSHLARDMMLSGHRRFLAVERKGRTCVTEAIRRAAQRIAPDTRVDSVYPNDVPAAVEQDGVTAVICDSRTTASQVREILARHNIDVPGRVSMAAVGSASADHPCSGYFVHSEQKARTIIEVIRDTQLRRPLALWLTGAFVDAGTIAPPLGALHATATGTQERRFTGATN